jgi:signal transduction histidine kinase
VTDDSSEQRIKELEKENRILCKKLERTERNLLHLEKGRQQTESILKTTIAELRESQAVLEARSQELEQALIDLQSMQTRLFMAEKMSALGVLVAGIAHEINNPVGFIYGNLNHASQYTQDLMTLVALYQQYYPSPVPEIEKWIQTIDLKFLLADFPKVMHSMEMGAERIKEIVLSLRNFSRMDEAESKTVDIHAGIDNTLILLEHRLKAQADRPAIQVIKQYGELLPIECYAGQLNQVFMNILVNAIEALEEIFSAQSDATQQSCLKCHHHPIEQPTICIQTNMTSDQIRICITDNGPGIPAELQSRLFDPFFTTKPVGKGTGMGLSISYQIVTERHGGQLQCISIPNQGTTFMIELPFSREPERSR